MEFLIQRGVRALSTAVRNCRAELCAWLGAVLLGCALSATAEAQSFAADSPEYAVKAAFLLNFTRFVQWPAEAFGDSSAPITICVLGRDPFGPVLDEILAGERVSNRSVVARRIAEMRAAGGCQLLFVSSDVRGAPQLFRQIAPGILTVGDGKDFLDQGGMIQFDIEDRRVRFDVSQTRATEAGFQLSSQMLRVARRVE